LLEPSKTREFERAMAELQQRLWIVKTEERYEPTFSYRLGICSSAGCTEPIAEGRRLRRSAALDHLLSRYLRAAVYGVPASLATAVSRCRVPTWMPRVTRLARAVALSSGWRSQAAPGRFVVSA
jgi:hypothetical protein